MRLLSTILPSFFTLAHSMKRNDVYREIHACLYPHLDRVAAENFCGRPATSPPNVDGFKACTK
jgi:hypothetical protein